ncbi:teneurin-3 [Arapaima gigas]
MFYEVTDAEQLEEQQNRLRGSSQLNPRSRPRDVPRAAGVPSPLQTTPESVPLQDSWVLGSNVPLESRHFLFKTGTGTTPLFSTATPGYTMATGAVYSPPTRPLPRNTLSRSAFKFKKSSKHCSWRCTALSAVAVSVLLSVLLCYCIGNHGDHTHGHARQQAGTTLVIRG